MIELNEVAIDNEIDKLYKPGLYKQVEAFMNSENQLMEIQEQAEMLPVYEKMSKNEYDGQIKT